MNNKNTTVLALCILFVGFLLFYQQKSFVYISEQKEKCKESGEVYLQSIKQKEGVKRTDIYFYSKKLDACMVYIYKSDESEYSPSTYAELYNLWTFSTYEWYVYRPLDTIKKSDGTVKSFEEIIKIKEAIE